MTKKKDRCPDYTEACHQKLGVVACRDGQHKNYKCPVIQKDVEYNE
jgi:hypothetical protein